jgi:hypothetical protein
MLRKEAELPMVHSVVSTNMTAHQISLVEQALRQVFRIEQTGWDGIPLEFHPSFEKYMCRDIWTGQCDLLTLREAALLIVRDAITRTGEFRDGA